MEGPVGVELLAAQLYHGHTSLNKASVAHQANTQRRTSIKAARGIVGSHEADLPLLKRKGMITAR